MTTQLTKIQKEYKLTKEETRSLFLSNSNYFIGEDVIAVAAVYIVCMIILKHFNSE